MEGETIQCVDGHIKIRQKWYLLFVYDVITWASITGRVITAAIVLSLTFVANLPQPTKAVVAFCFVSFAMLPVINKLLSVVTFKEKVQQ